MAGPGASLEHLPQGPGVDPGVEAGWVELLGDRGEQQVDAGLLRHRQVGGLVARVAGEVVGGVELGRVDEEGHHHHVAGVARGIQQRPMPGVEGAHGRHQADALAAATRLAEVLAGLGNRSNDPHDAVASTSAR